MIPTTRRISETLLRRSSVFCSTLQNRYLKVGVYFAQPLRGRKDDSTPISSLFKPVSVKPNPDDINVGVELSGNLDKQELLKVLNQFYSRKEIKLLAKESGLDTYLHHQAFISFRRYCLDADALSSDLHVVISDILQGSGHVADIFPYYLRHAKQMFPHIECMDDLKQISDLRTPANWYPLARAKIRKIIFHVGPTNSGKTYHALERFMTSQSGVYCGPLKLLAAEVYSKCNDRGTPCDLVTGEERNYAQGEGNQSNHISCTVEMTSVSTPYEVAIIDEVQLIKDPGRGWAWTRALLGVIADEVHLCGEAAAIDLVRSICVTTGEDVEVRRYKRLTPLEIEQKALVSIENVLPGDCVVCFSKNDIYSVSRAIEARGIEVAVIYGSLPPGTKLAQAAKFNDVNNPCKVLIATDAIGMGLNLSIRRIIFHTLMKPSINEKGEKEMEVISVSSALQIAGRAGRFGTQWEKGYVTTYRPEDLSTLERLLSQEPEVITQAGLHPTPDQIELYAYYLPNSTLSNLMDIFVSLSIVDDSLYFMCNMEEFKFLADMIQHVPLPLRARYVFCCAPVNKKIPFVCTMFLKFARQYSKNEMLTFDWVCQNVGWPVSTPNTIIDLIHLEAVFDVMDLYLWFSYRFIDLFPDAKIIRDTQKELDAVIQDGVLRLTRLLKNSESGGPNGKVSALDEDRFVLNTQKNHYYKGVKSVTSQIIGEGKLTQRLLDQGLLTAHMLDELRKEWEQKSNNFTEDPRRPKRTRNN
ncbi:ATP-dependent RNA helicase SUV3 homolog, mitochondrial isoform X2 [Athalia rosae]|uniref:ATP-dependent RNA helicase SUV3 homolog, mitochondrial isoform X2 n=1 Tax=Athalia rosae TaxID=37344 RepID=UPI0020335C63|nr:ATP-dependent RNA helicase SUV3 homolog, mitochondrial isoform X2 [Athalia rosae]